MKQILIYIVMLILTSCNSLIPKRTEQKSDTIKVLELGNKNSILSSKYAEY